MLIQAGRQFAYHVARLMADSADERGGTAEAAMAVSYTHLTLPTIYSV